MRTVWFSRTDIGTANADARMTGVGCAVAVTPPAVAIPIDTAEAVATSIVVAAAEARIFAILEVLPHRKAQRVIHRLHLTVEVNHNLTFIHAGVYIKHTPAEIELYLPRRTTT